MKGKLLAVLDAVLKQCQYSEADIDFVRFKYTIQEKIKQQFSLPFTYCKQFEDFMINQYETIGSKGMDELEIWDNASRYLFCSGYLTQEAANQLNQNIIRDVHNITWSNKSHKNNMKQLDHLCSSIQQNFNLNNSKEEEIVIQQLINQMSIKENQYQFILPQNILNDNLMANNNVSNKDKLQKIPFNLLEFEEEDQQRKRALMTLYFKFLQQCVHQKRYKIVNEHEILRSALNVKLHNGQNQLDRDLIKKYNNMRIRNSRKIELIIVLRYVLETLIQSSNDIHGLKDCEIIANVFGSLSQGTSLSQDSDIDVEIKFSRPKIRYDKSLTFIQRLVSGLNSNEFKVNSVINQKIRVPFISIEFLSSQYLNQIISEIELNCSKIEHKNLINMNDQMKINSGNLKIDLIYDNELGILNSRLFNAYINLDIRVLLLTVLFKQWANESQQKHKYKLTSYALLNMVIYFLIKKGYIRSLQDHEYFNFDEKVENLNIFEKMNSYSHQIQTQFENNKDNAWKRIQESIAKNELKDFRLMSISQLYIEVLQFYLQYSLLIINQQEQKPRQIAYQIIFKNQNQQNVIPTVERISTLPKYLKKPQIEKNQNVISIQDPFDPIYDPGSRKEFNINEFHTSIKNYLQKLKI